MTLQQLKEQEIAEFEKNLQSINNRGMADIPSAIGYFRQAVLHLEQAIREEERKNIRIRLVTYFHGDDNAEELERIEEALPEVFY